MFFATPCGMLKRRLIARLDVRNEWLIKPVRLEGVRKVGDPHEYATRYDAEGIDEILYVDCVASLYGRNGLAGLVERTTDNVFVPVTVAGGIRAVADVRELFRAGADKVAVNTAALERPGLLTEIAEKFGSQAVVLQIDAKRTGDGWECRTHGGRQATGAGVVGWAKEAVERGAGEILLTSVDREGTRRGMDTDLVASVACAVPVPVVVSGGVGSPPDVAGAIRAGADAVACAHVLHYGNCTIAEIKAAMAEHGIPVRMAA